MIAVSARVRSSPTPVVMAGTAVNTTIHRQGSATATITQTGGWLTLNANAAGMAEGRLAESFKIPGGAGVLIAGVERNGPAEKGGVKPGDVLIAVNGRATRDPAAMLDAVAGLAPGSQATLKLRRAQNELEVAVTVGKRPPAQRRPAPR